MSIPLRLRYFSSLSMLMAASSVSAVRSNRYRHSVRVCRRSYAVGCTGVTLRNTQTGATLVATTDKDGVFQSPGVLVGSYSVQVAATGFKAYELNWISLSSAETRNLGRLRLEIGGVPEQVKVTAQATPAQTSSSEMNQTVEQAKLEELSAKAATPSSSSISRLESSIPPPAATTRRTTCCKAST